MVCYKTARVLFDLFEGLSLSQDPSHDAVIAASDRMERIRHEVDRASQDDTRHSRDLRTQRYLIDMTIAYRDYQCHRLYFVKALNDTRFSTSYAACLNAAETIRSIFCAHLPRPYRYMWNTAVMAVAAGVILALDYIFKPSNSTSVIGLDQRSIVSGLVGRLRELQDPSRITVRGATIIAHLISLGDDRRQGRSKEVSITREAVLELVNSSKSSHIPEDVLWERPAAGQDLRFPDGHFEYQSDPVAVSETALGQPLWNNPTDQFLFSQDNIDLDFAHLLEQIMPNAG
jgi:hypothetical protein